MSTEKWRKVEKKVKREIKEELLSKIQVIVDSSKTKEL